MEGIRLAVIGAGTMGKAILQGAFRQNIMSPAQVWLSNPHEDKLSPFGDMGVNTTTSNREAAEHGDVILLAVKPQCLGGVLEEIADLASGKCVVSIAAGVSYRSLCQRLKGAWVVCVMPNTPLTLGCGACAMTEQGDVPDALYRFVHDLFACAGLVEPVKPEEMNRMIPVNGSSPAFFFRMVRCMVRAAADSGLDEGTALRLAAKTMEGAALMLQQSGKTAAELEAQVCSPGGTTLAALTAFDEWDFDAMMQQAFARCVRRAQELGTEQPDNQA